MLNRVPAIQPERGACWCKRAKFACLQKTFEVVDYIVFCRTGARFARLLRRWTRYRSPLHALTTKWRWHDFEYDQSSSRNVGNDHVLLFILYWWHEFQYDINAVRQRPLWIQYVHTTDFEHDSSSAESLTHATSKKSTGEYAHSSSRINPSRTASIRTVLPNENVSISLSSCGATKFPRTPVDNQARGTRNFQR